MGTKEARNALSQALWDGMHMGVGRGAAGCGGVQLADGLQDRSQPGEGLLGGVQPRGEGLLVVVSSLGAKGESNRSHPRDFQALWDGTEGNPVARRRWGGGLSLSHLSAVARGRQGRSPRLFELCSQGIDRREISFDIFQDYDSRIEPVPWERVNQRR